MSRIDHIVAVICQNQAMADFGFEDYFRLRTRTAPPETINLILENCICAIAERAKLPHHVVENLLLATRT